MRNRRAWIPNAFTLGNLLSGVGVAIGLIEGAEAWVLLVLWGAGLLCDVVDGAAARALGVAGPLGVQLDSLADGVTSGVVPSLVAWVIAREVWPNAPQALAAAGLTMAAAAAYRLARFNVAAAAPPAATAHGFTGLPAPAGAVWWIGTWSIAAAGGPDTAVGVAWVLGVTAVPWAMVSRWPLPDFKGWGKDAAWDRSRRRLLGVAGGVLSGTGIAVGAGMPVWWGGVAVLAVLLLYAVWNGAGQLAGRFRTR